MLNYQDSGEHRDRTVVLLHAFPLSARMWAPQQSFLEASGYRVIAPNTYGFDGSPSKPGWTMDDYAHDLASLLDSLGCEKATIVGLSMGGYQAFAFWRMYPGRTASLVLCDTRANADAPEALRHRQEFREAVEKHGSGEAGNRMVPNFFTSRTLASCHDLEAMVRDIVLHQPASEISDAMRAIAERPDSTKLLNGITCPVLFINGEEDTVTTPETASAMHALLPGSKLELIPDAAHLSNLEQPGHFNRILLEHLENLR